jgi:hypothetical protein
MQAEGGRLPVPVSSYTTSTLVAEKTRRVVEPVHEAPAYNAPHMLTVNVWPALAVTPHTGSLLVSVLVWLPVNSWQDRADVGATVGVTEGTAVGAVGCVVGVAVGTPAATVGPAVGKALGMADGFAVVGLKVGIDEGH